MLLNVTTQRAKSRAAFLILSSLVLSLSACGNKKETYPEGHRDALPIAKQTTSQGSEGSVEAAPAKSDKTPVRPGTPAAGGGSELPPPGGPEQFETGSDDSAAPADPVAEEPAPPKQDPVTPPPVASAPTGPVDKMVDEAGRTYSTSAADGLAASLTAQFEDPNQEVQGRARNVRLARNILSASLSRNTQVQRVSVKVQFRDGVSIKNLTLNAPLSTMTSASLVAEGSAQVSGHMRCLDNVAGTCENALVRLTFQRKDGEAVAFILFREAVANLYFDLPGKRSSNPEYAKIRKFALDSIQNNETSTKVQVAALKTFEVISGRAGFEAKIKTFDNELIAFAGPLVAGSNADAVLNVPLKIQKVASFKSNLSDLLGSSTLVKNNGAGVLEISAKMRKKPGFAQDVFKIRFTRNLNPIVPMSSNPLN